MISKRGILCFIANFNHDYWIWSLKKCEVGFQSVLSEPHCSGPETDPWIWILNLVPGSPCSQCQRCVMPSHLPSSWQACNIPWPVRWRVNWHWTSSWPRQGSTWWKLVNVHWHNLVQAKGGAEVDGVEVAFVFGGCQPNGVYRPALINLLMTNIFLNYNNLIYIYIYCQFSLFWEQSLGYLESSPSGYCWGNEPLRWHFCPWAFHYWKRFSRRCITFSVLVLSTPLISVLFSLLYYWESCICLLNSSSCISQS